MTDASCDPEAVAARHDLPADAIAVLAEALRRGGGRQAQFSHPALGGMGQWSRGGAIMIGDMFDHDLKARVGRACAELADGLDDPGAEARTAANPWPPELGSPSASGSQNETAYAFFPQARRLVIRTASGVNSYETGDHRITGVSQQQGGADARDLVFTSQHGAVRLRDLPRAPATAAAHETDGAAAAIAGGREPVPRTVDAPTGGEAILALLERLYELQRKGILTEGEFSAKKAELLARL